MGIRVWGLVVVLVAQLFEMACFAPVTSRMVITATPEQLLVIRSGKYEDGYQQMLDYGTGPNGIGPDLGKLGGSPDCDDYTWIGFVLPFPSKHQYLFAGEHFSTHFLVVGNKETHSIACMKRMGPELRPYDRQNRRLFSDILEKEDLAPITPLKLLQYSILYLKLFAVTGDVILGDPGRRPCYSVTKTRIVIHLSTCGLSPTLPNCDWTFTFTRGGRLIKVRPEVAM